MSVIIATDDPITIRAGAVAREDIRLVASGTKLLAPTWKQCDSFVKNNCGQKI